VRREGIVRRSQPGARRRSTRNPPISLLTERCQRNTVWRPGAQCTRLGGTTAPLKGEKQPVPLIWKKGVTPPGRSALYLPLQDYECPYLLSSETTAVPIYYLAKPQPRERAWKNQRGKKTLLSLTLIWHCSETCRGVAYVGDPDQGGRFRPFVSGPTLKYHYSHRFPTYSVERNARFRPRARPAGGRRPVASSVCRRFAGALLARGVVAVPSACARSCRAAVDIPVALSTSRGIRASNRGPRPSAYGRPSKVAVRVRGVSAGPVPGAIRIPRTPPGGEFDWGGTSVKK